jgi:hypothetical protein
MALSLQTARKVVEIAKSRKELCNERKAINYHLSILIYFTGGLTFTPQKQLIIDS